MQQFSKVMELQFPKKGGEHLRQYLKKDLGSKNS